jgi:GTP-binding protein
MSVIIQSSSFVISSPSLALCPATNKLEFAFIGRSNVGKSSLINALCDKRELAKTSSKPGKTQLINYFAIESVDEESTVHERHLVDLPWYGYAKVTREQRASRESMIAQYMQKRKTLAHVFVLIDSRHTPQKLDVAFISQLHLWQKPFSLIFTKSDQVSQKEASTHIKGMMQEIRKTIDILPAYYTTSAQKRHSTQWIIAAIHAMNNIHTD